ncbi:MAG: hypothetical protein ABI378_06390 [Chitinophagaceae bacterium]
MKHTLFFTLQLILGFIFSSIISQAQDNDVSTSVKVKTEHPNAITATIPAYVKCTKYGGIALGLEYSTILGKRQNMSAGCQVNWMIWAGTNENKEYYAEGVRANIAIKAIAPTFNYYPFGTKRRFNLELGVLCQLGAIRRIDSYRPGRDHGDVYDTVEHAGFVAPQLHLAMTYRARKYFTMSWFGDFGPILMGGERTKGNYGLIGLKLGRMF